MLSGLLTTLILADLDQTGRLQAMRQGFDPGTPASSTDTNMLLAVLVIVVGSVGIAAMLAQMLQRDRRGGHGPKGQFLRRAMRVLALKPDEMNAVHTVASRSRMSHPTAMLLSPANLAHAELEARKRKDDKALREKIDDLSVKLFGTALPDIEPERRKVRR